MKRFKRIFIISFIVITVLVVIVIACISPITKYLVEKYDVKYTGREISMSSAYVNPFTGFVRFNQLKIKENDYPLTYFFLPYQVSSNEILINLSNKS
jgi:hypothetical protein